MNKKFIKIFSFIFVLVFMLLLVGCTQPVDEKEILKGYHTKLLISLEVKKDFELPTNVDNKDDHSISWVSADEAVLKVYTEGDKCLVAVTNQEQDVKVKLTATITMNSGLSMDKDFKITVKAKEKDPDPKPNPDPDKPLKDQFECITIPEAIEIATNAGETETEQKYYVYGIIKSVSNPTYGEMTITDGTNELYVYGSTDEEGNFYSKLEDKPVAGDEIVLYGGLKTFKDSPEMGRSVIKGFNHIKQEVDEKEYEAMTIADARSAKAGEKVKVTGVVATITNAFGFVPNGVYLVDNTGAIYVYGGDVAAQVSVGNTITVAAEKTYYINPDESGFASKYGYEGALQLQKPILLENDKGNAEFNKAWIKNSTVKDIMSVGMDNNITSDIYKVNALIKKVPGSGFTNYYINDLDGKTGSYVYTMCNGNDFTWLDQYDGKICTVYLSPINCKATASGTLYRFIPVLVEDNGFKFDLKDACAYAIKYHALDQFKELYQNNPTLEVITSVSSELLGFEGVELSYASSNTNVVYFENNVMNTKDDGEAKVTITAKYNDYTATEEITIKVKQADVSGFVNVKAAIESEDGSVVKVKGIVVASLVNQTGFYIGDETGIIAVTCSGDTLAEMELGQEVVIEGTKIHRKKDAAGDYAGQLVISDAKLVVNYYGNHEYSKASFITDKDLKYIYDLDKNEDHSAEVYVVKGLIEIVETSFYTNINIKSEDGKTTLGLYCSSAKQYNWLKEFQGKVVTLEIAPVNWNGKDYYRGCVIAATDGEKTLINNLNFAN